MGLLSAAQLPDDLGGGFGCEEHQVMDVGAGFHLDGW